MNAANSTMKCQCSINVQAMSNGPIANSEHASRHGRPFFSTDGPNLFKEACSGCGRKASRTSRQFHTKAKLQDRTGFQIRQEHSNLRLIESRCSSEDDLCDGCLGSLWLGIIDVRTRFRVLIHASMHFSRAISNWLQMDGQLQQRPPDRIATLPRTKRNSNRCHAERMAYSINASDKYFFFTQKAKAWLKICERFQAYPRNQKLKFRIYLLSSQFIAINATRYFSTLAIKSAQVACSSCIRRRRRSTCWDQSKSLILPEIWITYIHLVYLLINLPRMHYR